MPNPKLLLLLCSFKHELKLLFSAFLIVLSVPIIAVVVLTHTGLEVVSDALVQINPLTKAIQLYYPNGQLFKETRLQVNWPVQGVVTQGFGEAEPPFYLFHTGIDIASPNGRIGDPVTPAMKGKVTYAGEIFWGFGKHIIIDHGDNISTIYAHLDQIYIKAGDEVEPGKVIGAEGNTGWSTGPHLHFQVNVFGIPVNPRVFLGS
jgi:murein DD-endopeptidase MepM/ murein hydrolase activator NlpD